jgi:hypothetical protein
VRVINQAIKDELAAGVGADRRGAGLIEKHDRRDSTPKGNISAQLRRSRGAVVVRAIETAGVITEERRPLGPGKWFREVSCES